MARSPTLFPVLGRTTTVLVLVPALLSLGGHLSGVALQGLAGFLVGAYRLVVGFLAEVPWLDWIVEIDPAEIDLLAVYGFAVLPAALGAVGAASGSSAQEGNAGADAARRVLGLALPFALPFTVEGLGGIPLAAAIIAAVYVGVLALKARLAAGSGASVLAGLGRDTRLVLVSGGIALGLAWISGVFEASPGI